MGFVKTQAEIAGIDLALRSPRFVGEMLSVDLLADAASVRRLLPPPLRPAPRPDVTVMIGRFASNCAGDFRSAAVYVSAVHEGIAGRYLLANYVDRDAPLVFGREAFGEPKKLARCRLTHAGPRAEGWVERHGVRLLDVRADLSSPRAESHVRARNFNVSARGLTPPVQTILTTVESRLELTDAREGEGEVTIGSTTDDPLDELTLVSVGRATLATCDMTVERTMARAVDADDVLAYIHGRNYDWSGADTLPRDA